MACSFPNNNNAIKKGTSSKDLWENLHRVQNNDNLLAEPVQLPSEMVFNGECIRGAHDIIESFNKHFINILGTLWMNGGYSDIITILPQHIMKNT